MLKVPPTSQHALALCSMLNSFNREKIVYYELIPAFNEMYRKAGKTTRIAPRTFKFDKDLGFDVILMEDLRSEGFMNMNRLEGLDMEHTKNSLNVIAEFHAASATYIAENGGLPDLFMQPLLNEKLMEMLVQSQRPQEQLILDSLPMYNAEHLKEKMVRYPGSFRCLNF